MEPTLLLIDISIIQNHSPSNQNRDDLGAPKTTVFNGIPRSRISSQCLKRSIRRNTHFAEALIAGGGVRTRHLIEAIAKRAYGESASEKLDALTKVFADGGVTYKKDDKYVSDVLWFLPDSTITELASAAKSAQPKEWGNKFAEILKRKASVPDIALCGRMIEIAAKNHFANIDFSVEAALSAAHAISTHEAANEIDYFTAVDDIKPDTGAGHVGEAMYVSACYYKFFSIDWNQLVRNLGDNVDLARLTVKCFLHAAAKAIPSGKQTSSAAFNLPDGILVEVKSGKNAVPISYANAFADPVPHRVEGGIVRESIARLGQHVHEIEEGYGIESDRFWFSPGSRYPLQWRARDEQGFTHSHEVISIPGRLFGSLDKMAEGLMAAIPGSKL